MKKSKFIQKIGDSNNRLYYHSLFGNLFLLEKNYIDVLEDENPSKFIGSDKDTIIAELRANYYLIDASTDERLILKERNTSFLQKIATGKNITSLDLNISELCNFVCPHCMNGCQIQNKTNKLMSWNTAKLAIDTYAEIIKKNNIIGEIHFGSAEPLINWNIIKSTVNYCKHVLPKTPISINTNLSLLNQEKAIFLRDNRVLISTSLDGPKEGNNKIRINRKGGTYDIIMSKIKLLKKIGYPIDALSITMNDLNIETINEDFIHFTKEMGCVGLATDIDLVNNKNCNKEVDFYVDKIMHIYQLCKDMGIYNFGSWSLIYSNLIDQENDEPITYCKAQTGRNISINPVGDIFLCGYSTSKVGNIDTITNMLSDKSAYTQLISSKLPGNQERCIGCNLEGICSGQCLVTHEFNKDNKNKLDFLCEFYRKCTSNMLDIKLKSEVLTV